LKTEKTGGRPKGESWKRFFLKEKGRRNRERDRLFFKEEKRDRKRGNNSFFREKGV